MITSGILYVFAWMLGSIALVLPTGSMLPENFSSMFSSVINYTYGWNWIIPIDTLFAVLTAMIFFLTIELIWNSSKWFVQYIRGN